MPDENSQPDIITGTTGGELDINNMSTVTFKDGAYNINGTVFFDEELEAFDPGDRLPLPSWLSDRSSPYDNIKEPYENVIFIRGQKIPIAGFNDAQQIYDTRGAIERNSPSNDGIMSPQRGARILSREIGNLSDKRESGRYYSRSIFGALTTENEAIEKRNRKPEIKRSKISEEAYFRLEEFLTNIKQDKTDTMPTTRYFKASKEIYSRIEDFVGDRIEQTNILTDKDMYDLFQTTYIKPLETMTTAIKDRIKKGQERQYDKGNLKLIERLTTDCETFYKNALDKKLGEGSVVYLYRIRDNHTGKDLPSKNDSTEKDQPPKHLCKPENAYNIFETHQDLKGRKGNQIHGSGKRKPYIIGIDLESSILECLYLEGQNTKTNIIDAFLKTESYKDVESAINKLKSMKMISSKREEIKITPLGRSAYEDIAIRAIEEVKDYKGIYSELKSKATQYGITTSPRNKNTYENMPNMPVKNHHNPETDKDQYSLTKPGEHQSMRDIKHSSGTIFNLAHASSTIR